MTKDLTCQKQGCHTGKRFFASLRMTKREKNPGFPFAVILRNEMTKDLTCQKQGCYARKKILRFAQNDRGKNADQFASVRLRT